MRSFRFLHAADLHLDSPFRGMTNLPESIRTRVRESTFTALRQLIEIAVREKVDFIVISGDIYDLADRSLRAQIRFQNAMEELAEHGISAYIIHGNHDPEDGRRAELSWPESVHFFPSDDVLTLPHLDREGRVLAHIHGISYPTSAVSTNLASQFTLQDSAVYNIAMLHANVDGDPAHDNYAPCSKQELLRSGIDYWALGHIHTRRILHANPHIVYPGNIQGRSVRELGAKGCYVVDVSDTGETQLTFHACDALRWFDEAISIQGISSEQELKDELEQQMDRIRVTAGGRPAMVRFTFQGRGSVHRLLQQGPHLQELIAEICEQQRLVSEEDEHAAFVWIESCKVQSGSEVEMEQLLAQDHFLGDLLRISQRFVDNEEELKTFTEQAFSPMLSHVQAGKYFASLSTDEQIELMRMAEELAIDGLLEDAGWED